MLPGLLNDSAVVSVWTVQQRWRAPSTMQLILTLIS